MPESLATPNAWQVAFADIQSRTFLRDNEQSLRAFVERAVHDLRHPLTGVRMSAEEALEVGAGRATEWVHRVLGFTNEVDTRIHNLIRAAMQTDGGTLRRGGNQKLIIRPMIERIIEQYRARIRTRKSGQRIDFHARADPVVLGNPIELRTIFENLVDNAVKYCYPGKVVRGTLDADVSQMTFTIENYGPGILPDEREKIWQRYYRGVHDSDRSGAVAGTGMGCYVVKQIVEACSGKVWFDSYPSARSAHDPEEASVGWGYVTRFHVVLPLGASS
jgi:signal transduction histidine kinase